MSASATALYRLCGQLSSPCATVPEPSKSIKMTDNDDPDPRLAKPPPGGQGKDELQGSTAPGHRPSTSKGPGARASRAAATDPEVPSAKRRGALRQLRSLFALAAVIVGLLWITFSLLYRAGRRVGTRRPDGEPMEERERRTPDDRSREENDSNPSAVNRMSSGIQENHASSSDDRATERSPAASASSSGKRPRTRDIIRTPTF
jgi:hypothetical protein